MEKEKYITTKDNFYRFDDDTDLITFNSELKKYEDKLVAFGFVVNDLLFEVNFADKSISVNGNDYDLSDLPTTQDSVRWISFRRKQKIFPTGEVKIVGYGFGFQFEKDGKNYKKLVFYDMERTRLE